MRGSPETMRRFAAWREAAAIRSGALFPRIRIVRQKARAARRALSVSDLAYNAMLDIEQMAAQPSRLATTTYTVGTEALTASAVRAILKKRALAAADQGLVRLFRNDLQRALDAISAFAPCRPDPGLIWQWRGCRAYCSGPSLVLDRGRAALRSSALASRQRRSSDVSRATEIRCQGVGNAVYSGAESWPHLGSLHFTLSADISQLGASGKPGTVHSAFLVTCP